MSSIQKQFIPFDLLSNFLTHTYFDTLEQLCIHGDYHVEHPIHSMDFIKSLKSFLFIFQNNSRNLDILQHQIFDFFTPYTYLTKSDILRQETLLNPLGSKIFILNKRSFHVHSLRKLYTKHILMLKKYPDYTLWKSYNIAFIHMHRNLVYHRFKEESSLPKLLKASNSSEFIIAVWEYYLDYLILTQNTADLYESINSLYHCSLPFSQEVLTYLKTTLSSLSDTEYFDKVYLKLS